MDQARQVGGATANGALASDAANFSGASCMQTWGNLANEMPLRFTHWEMVAWGGAGGEAVHHLGLGLRWRWWRWWW